MTDDTYRQAARRALLQAIPLERLQLFQEACRALVSAGLKPEDVLKRIMERAELRRDAEQLQNLPVQGQAGETGDSDHV